MGEGQSERDSGRDVGRWQAMTDDDGRWRAASLSGGRAGPAAR
jgi:hypothetical protein